MNFSLWTLVIPQLFFLKTAFLMLISSLIAILRNYSNILPDDIKINENSEELKTNRPVIKTFLHYITNGYIDWVVIVYLFIYVSDIIFLYNITTLLAIYCVGVFNSLVYIARIYSYRIIYTWIEDFYNDIHLSELPFGEIKARLQEEFSSGRSLETITYNKDE